MSRLTLLFLVLLLLTACGGSVAPTGSDPVGDEPTELPADPAEGEMVIQEMEIQSLDLLMLESFPVQVQAHVTGFLPNGCASVGEIEQRREGDTFFVTVPVQFPADAICTMILKEEDVTIPLEVAGLKAGEYHVVVNGIADSFTLQSDN